MLNVYNSKAVTHTGFGISLRCTQFGANSLQRCVTAECKIILWIWQTYVQREKEVC